MTLGQRMKAIRQRDKLRVCDCAWIAGMLPQEWHNIEAGRVRDPKWTTIMAIARGLGCLTEDLRTDRPAGAA